MRLNPVDLTFAILLTLAVVRGWSKGLLGTVAGYVAPVIAFLMAADWSDPVRERIAAAMPAPDFVLDLLAPFAVFVVVVATIRVGAALLSGVLGVGQSTPSRAGAGLVSAFVTGLVLGSFVLVAREMKPADAVHADDASEILLSPFEGFLVNLDRRFDESVLAGPLAELASVAVTTAAEHKDEFHLPAPETIEEFTREAASAAAEAAMRQVPVEDAAKAVQDATKKAVSEQVRAVDEALAKRAQAGAAAKPAETTAAKKPAGTVAAKPPEANAAKPPETIK